MKISRLPALLLLAFGGLSASAQGTDFFTVVEPTPAGHINVKDTGAIGDGVANDTAAIQSALDQAYLQAKFVFFPAGRYKVIGNLVPRDKVSLTGSYTGISMIEGDGGGYRDTVWANLVRNVTIKNMVFRKFDIQLYGSAANKTNGQVLNNIMLDGTASSLLYWGYMNPGLIQDNVFMRSTTGEGLNFWTTSGVTVQRNIIGMDLCSLDWLRTEYAGIGTWSQLPEKLAYLRQRLSLFPDQGRYKNAMYPLRETNITIQNNIINGNVAWRATTDFDHVIYTREYTNLKFVANWVRGWRSDASGSVKARNAYGPLVMACNFLDDTGFNYYIQDDVPRPYAFDNAIYYKNYIKRRTNFADSHGTFYYTNYTPTTTTYEEKNNYFDSNVVEDDPVAHPTRIIVGDTAGQWHVYANNVYYPSGVSIPAWYNPPGTYPPFDSGSIDPALVAPYASIPVPRYNIPPYHLYEPNPTGFTQTVCAGAPARLSCGTPDPSYSYTWNVGAPLGTLPGCIASPVWAAAGTYPVSLTGTFASCGWSGTIANGTVTVSSSGSPVEAANLRVAKSAGDLRVTWSPPVGASTARISRGTIASLRGGAYDHQVSGSPAVGACSAGVTGAFTLAGEGVASGSYYYLINGVFTCGEGPIGWGWDGSASTIIPAAAVKCP